MNHKIPENRKPYYGQADKFTCLAMSIYSGDFFSFSFFPPMPPHVLLGLCGSPPPAVAVV
jgi:hypothetical protein